ncbi:hypothetical protein ACFQAT_12350 [Undibacterium arcticum]|uniref:Uncharacterized protein n=1 Tax=Undibacterium arcticum TaxID=1762892 RepID=A0ABV7F704_9BURK
MTIIVIKDLPESVDLDRQAMVAITGGARTRGRQPFIGSTIFRSARIVNYPTGFTSKPVVNTSGQSAGNTLK